MSIIELRVDVDCHGCRNKIRKALYKLDGVKTVDIDMDLQKVTVTGWVDQQKVLKALRKTGKSAEPWPIPYDPMYHDFTSYYSQYYATQASNYYPEHSQNYIRPHSYFTIEHTPTYNYRQHGYNGYEYNYYQRPPPPAVYLEDKISTMFSEDNATGCRIM